MDKIILLIDMDGVLCDWYGNLLRIYKARYPDRKTVAQEEVTQFYVEELYPEEHRKDVMAIAREKGFYLSMDPLPGALAALKDIEENCLNFIQPYICTSPEIEFEDMMCHSEKVQWTLKHAGEFWVKNTILTKDKTVIMGDYLIDDKTLIKGNHFPIWEQINFDQPYIHPEAKHRFNWSHWPELKAKLLAEASQGIHFGD